MKCCVASAPFGDELKLLDLSGVWRTPPDLLDIPSWIFFQQSKEFGHPLLINFYITFKKPLLASEHLCLCSEERLILTQQCHCDFCLPSLGSSSQTLGFRHFRWGAPLTPAMLHLSLALWLYVHFLYKGGAGLTWWPGKFQKARFHLWALLSCCLSQRGARGGGREGGEILQHSSVGEGWGLCAHTLGNEDIFWPKITHCKAFCWEVSLEPGSYSETCPRFEFPFTARDFHSASDRSNLSQIEWFLQQAE